MADLEEAFNALNIGLANIRVRVETLDKELRESQQNNSRKLAEMLTRDDLKKIYESIQEVDKKRVEDNKKMLEEIERMVKELVSS